jgi:hypothetical protein
MHASLEDWRNGWFGVRLSASPGEIERLISLLQGLLEDPEQHFHIGSDFKGDGGIGDIELSVKDPAETNNVFLKGMAQASGDSVMRINGAPDLS